MDKQRTLRHPPPSKVAHLHNSFAHVPSYQYSQLSFKTFSDEEIKTQAGKASLPGVQESHNGRKRAGDFGSGDHDVRHQAGHSQAREATGQRSRITARPNDRKRNSTDEVEANEERTPLQSSLNRSKPRGHATIRRATTGTKQKSSKAGDATSSQVRWINSFICQVLMCSNRGTIRRVVVIKR